MTELYVSALHLDRKAIKALKITDPYSLHRVVYSLFEDVRSEADKHSHIQSGIVYADQGGEFDGYQPIRKVLMISDRPPAEQVKDEQGNLHGEVMCKSLAEEFLSHSRYQFKVQVNPVRKDKQTGKRMAIKGREATRQWFIDRAPKSWGFEVAEKVVKRPEQDPFTESLVQVDTIEVLQFGGKDQSPITIGKAHIQGTLTVTDPEQFKQSFKNGIGKGRAFGCGLLQIVPVLYNPFA